MTRRAILALLTAAALLAAAVPRVPRATLATLERHRFTRRKGGIDKQAGAAKIESGHVQCSGRDRLLAQRIPN